MYALPPLSPVAGRALTLYERLTSELARDVPGALELMFELEPVVVSRADAEEMVEMLREIHRMVMERARRRGKLENGI